MTEAPLCGLTATAMTALVDAVRAGDIEAAQALLPVDPIVKRAREICGRHFGDPGRFLRGDMDGAPMTGAVSEALCEGQLTDGDIDRIARSACYVMWKHHDYLSDAGDKHQNFITIREGILAGLRAA